MAGLLKGFSYDIFISYRQKDNKYDGWVTEFVDNLNKELEATFKEEISVYFDINPHDGLLETHDVDATLKGKLKCLIFIPIISRTYCDPKSFAWEREFKAFVEQASQDQFGLKVKLPNGNVASRVLPISIYNLDKTDIKLCESVLGGALRGVEFIYSEPGVNRPLKPDDDEKINLYKTKYRNQINKVGNAIKEIIQGLSEPAIVDKTKDQLEETIKKEVGQEGSKTQIRMPLRDGKSKLLLTISVIVLLVIITILIYPKFLKRINSEAETSSKDKMSIVVNRFDNKTGDASLDSWKDILPDLVKSYFTEEKEILITNSHPDFNVTGSYQKIKDKTLIILNLTKTKSDEILFSKTTEGNINIEYKEMVDAISRPLKDYLEIKVLEHRADVDYNQAFTNSAEAYRKYIEGMKLIMNGNYAVATKALVEAYQIDTTYAFAAFFCSFAYCYIDHEKAKYWEEKAYPIKDRLTDDYRMWLEFWHGWFATKNTDDILNYCSTIEKLDTKSRFILFDIGCAYSFLGIHDKSLYMFERVRNISNEYGKDWEYRDFYKYFAYACHVAGNFKKEANILKIGLIYFPNDIEFIASQAKLALISGNKSDANNLISKYEYLCSRLAFSEGTTNINLGDLFSEIDSLGRAEKYYRHAFLLEPDNINSINKLAYFLINTGRNVNEGLKLIDAALTISPDNFDLLGTKGWGFYKQGDYKNAEDLLEKSWKLCPSYQHAIYLHLEAVKKALAGEK
jgi:hypothetical protein